MSAYLKIIDLSQSNGVVDWPVLAKSVDGALIRAGYRGWGGGNIVFDIKAREYLVHAQAQGLPLGLYFVTQAVTDAEAAAEAEACAEISKDIPLRLPVFWDTEPAGGANGNGRADKLSRDKRTALALSFAKRARQIGLTPGVYCSDSWLSDCLNSQWLRVDRLPLWVASYPAKPGGVEVPPKNVWDGWQYSSTEQISGVNGNVDLNWFNPSVLRGHFSDTAGHWAEEAINRVKEAGIMNGKADRLFAPNDMVTRAELATALDRLMQLTKHQKDGEE